MQYLSLQYIVRVVVEAVINVADSLVGSFLIDEFEASLVENGASVPNVDNVTTCSCCGYCFRDKARSYYPCKSLNTFCTSICHGDDFGLCMNNRRVQENDSDQTVRH